MVYLRIVAATISELLDRVTNDRDPVLDFPCSATSENYVHAVSSEHCSKSAKVTSVSLLSTFHYRLSIQLLCSMNTVTSPSLGSNAPYIYKILPCGGSLVSISSDNSLRLADSHTLQYTHTINSIHDGVSCLATSGHCVLTAGRDGVKCTDLRKRSLSWTTETKVPVLSLAAQGNLVAVGTEMTNSQASIIIWFHFQNSTSLFGSFD